MQTSQKHRFSEQTAKLCPVFNMTTLQLERDANLSVNGCASAPNCFTTSNHTSLSSSSPAPFCVHFRFVVSGLMGGAICVLGLVGNLISVIVLNRDSKTPMASFQLMALAVADNLFLAVWLVQYPLRYVVEYLGATVPPLLTYVRLHSFPVMYTAQTWTIWLNGCGRYLADQTWTIWLTVVIAFTRYVAVCWPYHAPRFHNIDKVRMQVSVVTAFAIVYNLPR